MGKEDLRLAESDFYRASRFISFSFSTAEYDQIKAFSTPGWGGIYYAHLVHREGARRAIRHLYIAYPGSMSEAETKRALEIGLTGGHQTVFLLHQNHGPQIQDLVTSTTPFGLVRVENNGKIENKWVEECITRCSNGFIDPSSILLKSHYAFFRRD